MDDEEYSYAALQESLYRVETGNYEYRLMIFYKYLKQDAFEYTFLLTLLLNRKISIITVTDCRFE